MTPLLSSTAPVSRGAALRSAATLAEAIDAYDAETGSHSYAVGELAAGIAARVGLGREEVELVRLAGELHDIGKLAVPRGVLRKPRPLDAAERRLLERHPFVGFRMLETLGIEPVPTWVLHHHERWDGAGYPAGLAADEIPLGARILLAADAYDAMTSDRAYRPRLSHREAVTELERCAGTQFDPGVIAAFVGELVRPVQARLAAARSA